MKKIVELKAGKKFKIPKGYSIGKVIVEKDNGDISIFTKENMDIKRDKELIEILENKLKGGGSDFR